MDSYYFNVYGEALTLAAVRLAHDRALAVALTLITMPLLVISETKLRRRSRSSALPKH